MTGTFLSIVLTVGVSFHFLVSLWLSQFSPRPSYIVPFPKSHMHEALHSLTDVQPDHESFCLSSLLTIHFQAQTVLHLQQSLHSIFCRIIYCLPHGLHFFTFGLGFYVPCSQTGVSWMPISLNFSLRLFAHLTSILITTWIPPLHWLSSCVS